MTLTPVSRFVQHGDVRLHLLDSDTANTHGGGAPVVFVPGMSDMATDYAEVISHLGRRAVVIDRRGHGGSSAPPSGYSAHDHATDIGFVIDSLTDGPVHLMTFSRGTSYGLFWAVAHPQRVASLAIGDYPARELRVPVEANERFLNGRWRGTPVLERLDRQAAEATFGAAQNRTYWDELERMQIPVLAVRSSSPGPMLDDDWERYGQLARCQRVTFNDAGHDIFRGDRLRFIDLVRAHIDATGV